jgi:hypothetical protein
MISKNIFAEEFGENTGVFCSNCCYFLLIFYRNIGFEKNATFFRQKLAKLVIITSTPEEFAKKIAQDLSRLIFRPN